MFAISIYIDQCCVLCYSLWISRLSCHRYLYSQKMRYKQRILYIQFAEYLHPFVMALVDLVSFCMRSRKTKKNIIYIEINFLDVIFSCYFKKRHLVKNQSSIGTKRLFFRILHLILSVNEVSIYFFESCSSVIGLK